MYRSPIDLLRRIQAHLRISQCFRCCLRPFEINVETHFAATCIVSSNICYVLVLVLVPQLLLYLCTCTTDHHEPIHHFSSISPHNPRDDNSFLTQTPFMSPLLLPAHDLPSCMAPINPQICPRHKTTRITQQKHRRPSILICIAQPHQHVISRPQLIHLRISEGLGCLSCANVSW